MLLLVSGATKNLHTFPNAGTLVVPGAWNKRRELPPRRWAMDNGAYSGFNEPAFLKMLALFEGIPGCLFCTAPDVVADAPATLALWPRWRARIAASGYAAALVAQDGLQPQQVPWDGHGALFIGGTTAWKLSAATADLCAAARLRGVWVHMGRVNTRRRLRWAYQLGCDSVDGTGFSRWPGKRLPLYERWLETLRAQPELL